MDDENKVFFSTNALHESLCDDSFIGKRRGAPVREVAVEIPRSASAPVWTPAPAKKTPFMRRKVVLILSAIILIGIPTIVIALRLLSRTTE